MVKMIFEYFSKSHKRISTHLQADAFFHMTQCVQNNNGANLVFYALKRIAWIYLEPISPKPDLVKENVSMDVTGAFW